MAVFFHVLLGTAIFIFEISYGSACSNEQFECRNSGRCIQKSWVRDGGRDCSDNSDEEPCAYFQCTTERWKCVPSEHLCNGNPECQDASDESRTICEKYYANLPKSHPDEQKQNNCSSNEFECDNKLCIPKAWVRDGQNDCGDLSDERACSGFQCGSGKCIWSAFVCNGINECDDSSDESDLACGRKESLSAPIASALSSKITIDTTGTKCLASEFQCDNKKCVPIAWLRDGQNDCGDLSDERPCPGFQCGNGTCISSNQLCDKILHCDDGSDEMDTLCNSPKYKSHCDAHQFMCEEDLTCIHDSYVHDGAADCIDNSDEETCLVYRCIYDECALDDVNCNNNFG